MQIRNFRFIVAGVIVGIPGIDGQESPSSPSGNVPNYSLNRQISFDPTQDEVKVEGETESMTFYHRDNVTGDHIGDNINGASDRDVGVTFLNMGNGPVHPTSSSGILFQGSSSLSGGAFVTMAECSFVSDADLGFDEEDEDEDEDYDDDDDDDDGHSSMLSNVSLRISRGGAMATNSAVVRSPTQRSTTVGARRHDPLLLQTRGGAIASSTGADEFLRRLVVAALVTLMYEGSLGHILEFLKIVMQTAPAGTTYLSVLRDITSEKGITGLWDGFIPWGVVQAIAKGGVFGLAHAVAKTYTMPLVESGAIPLPLGLTIAGGIAGGVQGYVLSPTLLLKTRVMTNPIFREKMSLLKTTLESFKVGFDVVGKEGLATLMKGSNIFALKRFFDWSTRFFFSDMFEEILLKSGTMVEGGSLSAGGKIVASLLGGTASTIVTLPLDVIVAKSQHAKKAGIKVSAWKTFIKDYEEGGLKGLYDANMRGFEARLAHVCFTTVVMKTGSGIMYDFLYGMKSSPVPPVPVPPVIESTV